MWSFALAGKDYMENMTYLPVFNDPRNWTDRTVELERHLFPGYGFSRFDVLQRLAVLTTPGVRCIVSLGKEPQHIDKHETRASLGSAGGTLFYLRTGHKVSRWS
jgi:hypothetical protein